MKHLKSNGHILNCRQSRIPQFCTFNRKRLEDFTNVYMASFCLGYRPSEQDESYIHEMNLMKQFDMSKDFGFYPDMSKRNLYLLSEPTVPIVSVVGSFRSNDCIHVTQSKLYPLARHCCLRCMSIPNSREFKSLLRMVIEGPNKKRPIEHDFVGNIRIRYSEVNMRRKEMRLQLFNDEQLRRSRCLVELLHSLSFLGLMHPGL